MIILDSYLRLNAFLLWLVVGYWYSVRPSRDLSTDVRRMSLMLSAWMVYSDLKGLPETVVARLRRQAAVGLAIFAVITSVGLVGL